MVNGPGFISEPFPIDEKVRSRSSQEMNSRSAVGCPASLHDFRPERWLCRNENGHLRFDARGAPTMPFGAGPRGCFGRKLGMMELKIFLTLIIWNFELKAIPERFASFKGKEHLTHLPEQCFIRLEKCGPRTGK